MTGGSVVVLGPVGRNFAAGMSGGVAYVWDPTRRLEAQCNLAGVALEAVEDPAFVRDSDRAASRRHRQRSRQQILADWDSASAQFVQVMPHEYRRALALAAAAE